MRVPNVCSRPCISSFHSRGRSFVAARKSCQTRGKILLLSYGIEVKYMSCGRNIGQDKVQNVLINSEIGLSCSGATRATPCAELCLLAVIATARAMKLASGKGGSEFVLAQVGGQVSRSDPSVIRLRKGEFLPEPRPLAEGPLNAARVPCGKSPLARRAVHSEWPLLQGWQVTLRAANAPA